LHSSKKFTTLPISMTHAKGWESINPQFYWLFDPRYDFLLDYFVEYLKRHGLQNPKPVQVLSYQRRADWSTICVWPDEKESVFRVAEPDMVNQRFEEGQHAEVPENQDVLVAAFTGEGLKENRFSLTSTGQLADRLNHKGHQYLLCQEHELPVAPFEPLISIRHVRERHEALLKQWGRYVLKLPKLSGGYRMTAIENTSDLEKYAAQIVSDEEPLIACAFVRHQQSFSGVGCVDADGDVRFFCANEQLIYGGFAYMGLMYPAFIDNAQLAQVESILMKTGKLLHLEGYQGFFNVDLMLAEDDSLIIAEINARFGFSFLLFGCLFQEKSFDVLLDRADFAPISTKGRIFIVKQKGTMGETYQGLKSNSNLVDFYNGCTDAFETFYCGEVLAQRYEYGSSIGIAGARFDLQEDRANIVAHAEKCYLRM